MNLRSTRRWVALVCVGALVSAGLTLGTVVEPAAAAGNGTLSLYKAIENLATGASEGDRGKWDVQAVNTDTAETIRANGLNGFQTRVIPSGQYRISELATANTPAGYRFRDWNCGGTVYTDPTPVITLAEGQSLTCTITNEAVQSTLTLRKVVDGGSAPASMWTLQALDGPTGVGGTANTPPVTNQSVRIGTYRLQESGGPSGGGYTAGPWQCTYVDHLGNTGEVAVNGNNQITIVLDRAVTCTIVNTAEASGAQLTLVKQIESPDGEAHAPEDFTLTATPGSGGDVITGTTGSPQVSHVEAEVGVGYTLSETGPAGYTAGSWACTDPAGATFTLTGDALTLQEGADVTCTIVNEFTGGWLTLTKQVVDSAQPASAWTLTATGTGAAAGTTVEGTTGSTAVTRVPVPSGDYDLSEDGPIEGYTTDGFSCDGGSTHVSSVEVTAGAEITCAIVNVRNRNVTQLTLVKEVDNAGGGTLDELDWGLRAQGGSPPRAISGRSGLNTVTYVIVSPGAYTLTEGPFGGADVSGYQSEGWTCVDSAAGELPLTGAAQNVVDLAAGAQVTCTVRNVWQGSTITFRKQVINTPFGSHAPSEWDLAVESQDGATTVLSGNGANGIDRASITPGTYRLTETDGPGGYQFQSYQCLGDGDSDADPNDDLVTIPPSSDVVCTVTNRSVPPTLTLVKEIDNTGGGTASVADFTLKARGPGNAAISGPSGSSSVTQVVLPPGDYVFSEDGPAGYTAEWECTGGESWNAATGVAVLDVGDDMICTAVNTVQRPTLTLVKDVVGGPATAADWQLTADGPGAPHTGVTGDATVTGVEVDAGAYDLSEAAVDSTDPLAAGYTAGAWSCDAGALTGSRLTLAPGDDVTCTITNTWTGGTLTLVKVVDDGQVSPPGGATPGAWTLTAAGPVSVTGSGGSSAIVSQPVPAGDYDLSEALTAGPVDDDYHPGAWVCTGTGGTLVPGDPGEGVLTIAAGVDADVTCTLVNLFQPPHLTLRKVVSGGGPLSDTDDWTLAFTGGSSGSGVTGDDPITAIAVGSGTYQLSETPSDTAAAEGYATGAWSCTGGVVVDGGGGTAELTLTSDDLDVVCTITNTWTGSRLTLVKQVDDGGETSNPSGEATDWTLTAQSDDDVLQGLGGGTDFVLPGDYTLSEELTGSADADYRPGNWECTTATGTTFTPGDPGRAELTIDAGANADITCTLRNLLRPPHLTLVKHVTGGPLDALADWTLTANGGDDPIVVSAPADDPSLVGRSVGGGSFALSEVPTDSTATTAGYTTTGWSCDGGDLTASGDSTATLVLDADSDLDVTCEITNTWTGGSLTLVKQVADGSNGPGNTPANWTLTATGLTTVTGVGGSSEVIDQFVPAGDYTLTEQATAGDGPDRAGEYQASAWSCEGGSLVGGTVTVASGADVTCTITNQFLPPHLTLVKQVTGGGPASSPDDWPLSWDNPDLGHPGQGTGVTGEPEVTDVAVGSGTVTLTEQPVEGYRAGLWTCVGAQEAPVQVEGTGTATLTLTVGDANVTCTITNEWTGAQLTLTKVVDDGQEEPDIPGRPVDWRLSAIGGDDRLDVDGTGSDYVLSGEYALSETVNTTVDPEYRPGEWRCTGSGFTFTPGQPGLGVLDLEPGAVVTCTLSNLYDPPHLTLRKVVDGGPLPDTVDWTLQFVEDGGDAGWGRTGDSEITGVAVGAGTYTLSERPTAASASSDGYVSSGWSCDSASPAVPGPNGTATVTLSDDDLDVTCTITNTWSGGTLTLVKQVEGGTAAPGDWTLSATDSSGAIAAEGTSGQSAVTNLPVLAGAYSLSETANSTAAPLNQYAAGTWSCTGGALNGSVVQVGVGADVHCTVINVFDPPRLTLVKEVQGGSASPTDWTLTARGPVTVSGVTGDPLVTAAAVEPGTYVLAEEPVAGSPTEGYVAEGWNCGDAQVNDGVLVLGVGDDVTCVATNRIQDGGTAPPDGDKGGNEDLAATGAGSLWWLIGGVVVMAVGTVLLTGTAPRRRR
ncbi:prealbumin-like fold domain-containing protein [Propionicicella superfundia]|uniref:prealbumin-like fold domain-containing protein n=1 Tax=Propionicicella superfundia TaxID=348582 RepID=UPI00041A51B8|nr:hypothetical protein [Propionicicella superfundia]